MMNDMISKSKVLKWLEIQIADCSRELKRELFAEDLVIVSERLDTLKKVYDNIKDMTPLQLADSADKAEGYTKKEIETAAKNNCLTIRLNLAYAEIESLRKQCNEALKANQKQEWISCDEKLPKIYENVLIFTGNSEEDINLAVDIAFIDRNGHFSNDDCYYNHGEIKYWQPLPELPERKEKLAKKLCKEKTAKWINVDILKESKHWKCSNCNGLVETAHYCYDCYYKFCPNCGAEIKRGKENE